MSLNYNFAFKNSKLKRWERPAPRNLLTSDISIKKKIIYINQIFKNNPEIFYPPIFILISTLAIQLSTIIPTNNIKRLQSQHREYTVLSQKISTLRSQLDIMKKHLNNISIFFTKPTPIYLFAFYLQNSIPQGVQLNDYSINENGFSIRASSYDIEPLNEMLTLIIESPIINKDSIEIKNISRTGTTANKTNPFSNVVLEVHGNILKLALKKRQKLYEESSAHGLLRKLLRFNDLNLLIRS